MQNLKQQSLEIRFTMKIKIDAPLLGLAKSIYLNDLKTV